MPLTLADRLRHRHCALTQLLARSLILTLAPKFAVDQRRGIKRAAKRGSMHRPRIQSERHEQNSVWELLGQQQFRSLQLQRASLPMRLIRVQLREEITGRGGDVREPRYSNPWADSNQFRIISLRVSDGDALDRRSWTSLVGWGTLPSDVRVEALETVSYVTR